MTLTEQIREAEALWTKLKLNILFFRPEELPSYNLVTDRWVYEQ